MGAAVNSFCRVSTALALVAAFCACKGETASDSSKQDLPSAARTDAGPASGHGFTPAEIRRDKPMEIDTAATKANARAVEANPSLDESAIPPKTVVAKPASAASAPVPVVAASVTKNVEPTSAPVANGVVGQPGESGDWVLQVNVHRSEADAKAQIAKLGQQGIPAYAIPVPTGDATLSGNYWRVRVGRFQSRAEAQGFGKSVLEPKGLKFWVDKKTNEAKQGT
ncbi:MAG: SPOR domain-containing protein [Fibrobacterota bacterium]